MRSDLIYIPDSKLDALIQQDTPYLDLTTLGLDIGDEPGSLSFYTREPCVLCCTEEVSRILSKLGLSTAYSLPTGTQIGAGELFFTAEGSVCDLHRAWKICQSLLSHCSGVATKARNMLNRVQEISPAISLTAARAHFPGTKALVTKAVVAGGVIPHRMGLSETVLIYETHIACMGGLDVFLERYPQQKSHFCEKKVFVETTSAETALRCLSVGVDAIQFFQMQPDALAAAVEQLKAAYPRRKRHRICCHRRGRTGQLRILSGRTDSDAGTISHQLTRRIFYVENNRNHRGYAVGTGRHSQRSAGFGNSEKSRL